MRTTHFLNIVIRWVLFLKYKIVTCKEQNVKSIK